MSEQRNLSRKDMEARYIVFQKFALEDQNTYYSSTIKRHRKAARQVNIIRATIALLTGLFAAVVGLIASTGLNDCAVNVESSCDFWKSVINFCIIMATGLPAFAAFFNMLADLYQWDKLISIYDAANENIQVADAHSPLPEMDDAEYEASIQAYALGTLDVMSDETAQWGQSIRTPKGMQEFLEDARERATKLGGDASSHQAGFVVEGDNNVIIPPDTGETDATGSDEPS